MSKIKTKKQPARQAADRMLTITRVFDAPRSLVFQAWTQPERVKRWWGPKTFTTPVCEIDLRVGGVLRTCMRSPEGQEFWSQGVYREIVDPERIVCTDSFADEKGNVVSPEHYGISPEWPAEALITVTFAEQAGKTRMTLQHSPLPPGRERDLCRQGWEESFDKLADYLAEQTRLPAEGATAAVRATTMRAVALDRFGGPEVLKVQTLPVPEIEADEILIQVEAAGVGVWDPFEREGRSSPTYWVPMARGRSWPSASASAASGKAIASMPSASAISKAGSTPNMRRSRQTMSRPSRAISRRSRRARCPMMPSLRCRVWRTRCIFSRASRC
jgi:uncharacterized protein YndB with AHSA1/START domain